MYMATDYANLLLEGIDVLIKERLKEINFDTTVKCRVVNNKNREQGEYVVSNGNITFMAYTNETTFQVDDPVLVLIPNNDYNNQKFIIGHEASETALPYVYHSPFQGYIDMTSNLYTGNIQSEYSLSANGYRSGMEDSYVVQEFNSSGNLVNKTYSGWIWEADFTNRGLIGYDRLGISGEFQTFLSEHKLIDGDYGLFLKVTAKENPLSTRETVHNFVLSAKQDFFGDIYNFDSFFHQEKVFDLSKIKDHTITKMRLYFYQDQSFIDQDERYIYSKDFTESNDKVNNGQYQTLTSYFGSSGYQQSKSLTSSYLPNIYVRDIYIGLGVAADNFKGNEMLLAVSTDPISYDSSQSTEALQRKILLRWARRDSLGNILQISKTSFGQMARGQYAIRWYRYTVGSTENVDAYGGEFWNLVKSFNSGTSYSQDPFQQVFTLRPEKEEERFKVLIVDNESNVIARSNEVIFKNKYPVQNSTQSDLLTGLGIYCGYYQGQLKPDDNQGSFFIYRKGNELVNKEVAQQIFSLIPVFSSKERYTNDRPVLSNATQLVWTIPASNSMIIPVFNSGQTVPKDSTTRTETTFGCTKKFQYIQNEDVFKITITPTSNNLSLFDGANYGAFIQYRIAAKYSPAAVRNTVVLDMIKDRQNYHTERQLLFGQSGTSGSDYTLIIDFKDENQVLSIKRNTNDKAEVVRGKYTFAPKARIVDQQGKIVHDFYDISTSDSVTIKWDWFVSEWSSGISKKVPLNNNLSQLFPVKKLSEDNTYCFDGRQPSVNNQVRFMFEQANGCPLYVFNSVTKAFIKANSDSIPNDSLRYYRKRAPRDGDADADINIYDFDYAPVNNLDKTGFDKNKNKLFRKYGEHYVLCDAETFTEGVQYYTPVYKEESIARASALTIRNDTQGETGGITFSSGVYSVFDIMNSVNILRATVSGFQTYDLVAYYPVPIRLIQYDAEGKISLFPFSITGATEVRYTSSGEMPDFYKNPYSLTYFNGEYSINNAIRVNKNTARWQLFCPQAAVGNDSTKFDNYMKFLPANIVGGILNPFSTYLKDAPAYGVQFKDSNGQILWSQPILVYQDNYPSTTINRWNGKDLIVDEQKGTILATQIGAGKKEKDNTFSGVLLGDWNDGDTTSDIAAQTGVYGFSHGKMSYALKEDGTAFFGKDGAGRIHLDGEKAQLYSSNWFDATPEGMMLDLDDGVLQIQHNNNRYIEIAYGSKTSLSNDVNNNNYEVYEYRQYLPITSGYNAYQRSSYLVPVKFERYNLYKYVLRSSDIPSNWLYNIESKNEENVSNSVVEDLSRDNYRVFNSFKVYNITNSNITVDFYYPADNGSSIAWKKRSVVYTYTTSTSNAYLAVGYVSLEELYSAKDAEVKLTVEGSSLKYLLNPAGGYTKINTNNILWHPNFRYFRRRNSSKDQYLTLGDRTSEYALAIGGDKSYSARDFKVQWDGTTSISGDVTIKNGHKLDVSGELSVTGFGKIAGWNFNDKQIYSGSNVNTANIVLDSSTDGGKIIIRKGEISGTTGKLGGWWITTDKIHSGTTQNDTSNADVILDSSGRGSITIKNGTISGAKVQSLTGEIGGWTIGTNAIYAGDSLSDSNVVLNSSGVGSITVKNGTISSSSISGGTIDGGTITGGTIKGTNVEGLTGKIGGWTIGSNAIYSGTNANDSNVILNANGAGSITIKNGTIEGLTGKIGGWTLASNMIYSGTNSGTANVILHANSQASNYQEVDGIIYSVDTNITANGFRVRFFEGNREYTGGIGSFVGNNGRENTKLIGIISNDNNVSLGIHHFGSGDIGVRSNKGGVYLESSYTVQNYGSSLTLHPRGWGSMSGTWTNNTRSQEYEWVNGFGASGTIRLSVEGRGDIVGYSSIVIGATEIAITGPISLDSQAIESLKWYLGIQ